MITITWDAPEGIRPLFDRIVPGRTIAGYHCDHPDYFRLWSARKGIVSSAKIGNESGWRLFVDIPTEPGGEPRFPSSTTLRDPFFVLDSLADETGRVFWDSSETGVLR